VLTISHDALDCLDIDQAAPVFLAERMVQSAELINKSGRTMARSWLSKVAERGALVGAGLSHDVEMPAAIILVASFTQRRRRAQRYLSLPFSDRRAHRDSI